MLRTIYLYELKKLFRARVNLIALAGAVLMLLFLVIFSISEVQPVSREAAKELDGRTIDEELIEEMKPAMRFENGSTLMEITAESEKYVPVMEVITSVTGYYRDITRFDGSEFYALREQELKQRIEKQGLSETDKEFWRSQEAQVSKPFVYHYHSGPANLLKAFQVLGFFIFLLSTVGLSGVYARETADNMNQLLLCSRYGKKELYLIKFAAGSSIPFASCDIHPLFLCLRDGRHGGNAAVGEAVVHASLYARTNAGGVRRNLPACSGPFCRCDHAAVCDYAESAHCDLRIVGISDR